MTHFLCLSVTFLDPLFHGKGDDGPEWPPSPLRLFQALVAGARTGCRDVKWSSAEITAFRWLETREPPMIVAPSATSTDGYTFFVPNNDSDKEFEREQRLTSKAVQPHRLQDGDTVHYLWPLDERNEATDRVQGEVLCRAARHLLALGWGIDQVAGNGRILSETEIQGLLGRRWRAWKPPRPEAPTWRVPVNGSLKNLEQSYQSFLKRVHGGRFIPPLKPSRFGLVTYAITDKLPQRLYAAFELLEGIAFRQEDVAKVAAMLRSLTCKCASEGTHQFPGGSEIYVAGHVGKEERTPPRFSYLPLPTIGHEHADGLIRRLIVAEPYGGDGAHARWAQERLRSATLRDERGNDRGILLDLWRPHSKEMIQRYVMEAQVWRTVTPVILPGSDDGKYAKAEKLFLGALQQAGLPVGAVTDLTIRKAPFSPGAQHPQQYFVPAYLRRFGRWHVQLVFREPVAGPLAIGAGRHTGLGIFAAREK